MSTSPSSDRSFFLSNSLSRTKEGESIVIEKKADQIAQGSFIAQAQHGSTAIVAENLFKVIVNLSRDSTLDRDSLENLTIQLQPLVRRAPNQPIVINADGSIVDTNEQVLDVPNALLKLILAALNPPATLTPFQTPIDEPNFVGRQTALDELARNLLDAGTIAITGIYGMGGIGKSTLATRFAHLYRSDFPDGILWANLRTQETLIILDHFARAYGEDLSQVKSLSAKADVVRSILATKRALVILDNAEDCTDLEYLLPTVVTCATIVTSRDRDVKVLQGVKEIFLDLFTECEVLSLLDKIIGGGKIGGERDEAKQIAKIFGYLPLAIEIAGSLIKITGMTLSEYRISLKNEKKKLDFLEWRDRSIRASFNLTWQSLSIDFQELLSVLSIFGNSSINVQAIAAVVKQKPINVQIAMGNLIAVSFVNINKSARYYLHPLVKEFAAEMLSQLDCQKIYDLHQKMVSYFLNFVPYEPAKDDLLDEEYEHIMHAIKWASQASLNTEIVKFATNLDRYLFLKGYWDDQQEILQMAIVSSQELDNLQIANKIRLRFGEIAREQGNYQEAKNQYEACQRFFIETNDRLNLAHVTRELGELIRVQRNYLKARDLHRTSLRLYKELEIREGEGNSLHDLGLVERIVGNYDTALKLFRESLAIREELNDDHNKAYNLLEIGIVLRIQKIAQEAEKHLSTCLQFFQTTGDKRGQAYALRELGELEVERKEYISAEQYHEQSLRLRLELGDRRGQSISLHRLGRISQLLGNYDLARRRFEGSRSIADTLHDKLHKAFNLTRLGELAEMAGNLILAKTYWEQSLRWFEEMQVADAEVEEVKEHLRRLDER